MTNLLTTRAETTSSQRSTMNNAPDMLVLRNVSKSFGDTLIVNDFSLSLRRGEFISLLGPSGCGKTTTLRIVAGFLQPEQGELWLSGNRIDNVPSHRRQTAMVFQNYALFPHLTVFENVAFGPRMHKVPKNEVTRKVERALELVRLPSLGARYPRELSGGQQQRVALARAIALDPQLLLLDEPLSNLDAKLRKELRSEFLEIHRLAGMTTLFVTHDIAEAFAVSDRVAVMNHGRLEQYDTPHTVYTRPSTRFVADFVGHSNVVEGCLSPDPDGRPLLEFQGFSIVIPNASTRIGEDAAFAIPNHSLSVIASARKVDNCIPATLTSLVYLGVNVEFKVQIGQRIFNGEAPASAELLAMREGDRVFASWSSTDMIPLKAGVI